MISRFEEHYQYQLSSEISERIDLNKELGDMEEDYEQMFSYYEMEQKVTNYHGILGEVVSVDNQTMYIEAPCILTETPSIDDDLPF